MDKNAAIAKAAQDLADAMSVHGGRFEICTSFHHSERFSRWTYDIRISEIVADVEGSDLADAGGGP